MYVNSQRTRRCAVWGLLGSLAVAVCCANVLADARTGEDTAVSETEPDTIWSWRGVDWDVWLKPPPVGAPQPKLVCEETWIDVGDVWFGQLVLFEWEIANAGDAPLRITAFDG